MVVKHDFKPIMVHLLQQCAGIRKLVVEFPLEMVCLSKQDFKMFIGLLNLWFLNNASR
jgi:hypothetical protein